MKLGRCIKELERIYKIKQGGSGFYGNRHTESLESSNNYKTLKTEEDIAKEIGISIASLQNYKKLTEMIPELEELVDTGIATPTTALAIMRNLSEEEQRPSAFILVVLLYIGEVNINIHHRICILFTNRFLVTLTI